MKYKLLVLDIDGTIVKNQAGYPTERVINAVKKAKKVIQISLCTGRTKSGVKPILDAFELHHSHHIIEGGCKVINEKGIEEYEKLLTLDDMESIIPLAREDSDNIGYCIDGCWMSLSDIPRKGKVTNVSFNSINKNQTEAILKNIEQIKHMYHIAMGSHISHDGGAHIMISPKGASKELGIQYVQKKLGISIEKTMGMGDMHNDLPIFKRAGLKIAVGGGYAELIESADYVAPPLSEDPVAHIIEKFIL